MFARKIANITKLHLLRGSQSRKSKAQIIDDLTAQLSQSQAMTRNVIEQLDLSEGRVVELEQIIYEQSDRFHQHRKLFKATMHKLWHEKAKDKEQFEARIAELEAVDDYEFELHPITELYLKRDYEELVYAQFGDIDTELFVLFFDLNKFKLVNDQYGHAVGDRVLNVFGNAVKRIDGALSFSWGGDEVVTVIDKHRAINFIASLTAEDVDDPFIENHRSGATELKGVLSRLITLLIEEFAKEQIVIDPNDPILSGRTFEKDVCIALSASAGGAVIESGNAGDIIQGVLDADRNLEKSKLILKALEANKLLEEQSGLKELRSILLWDVEQINTQIERNLYLLVFELKINEYYDLESCLEYLSSVDSDALHLISNLLEDNGLVGAQRFIDHVRFPHLDMFERSSLEPIKVITGRE